MVNKEFFTAINEICEDRKLDKEKVFRAIEKGITNAYKKTIGGENVKIIFNEEENEYHFVEYYNVVSEDELDEHDPSKVSLKEARKHKKTAKIGDYFEIKRNVNPKDFGRVAIDATKQIFNQEIKRLEREKSYEYFLEHVDDIVDGTVVKISSKHVVVDLGYDTLISLPQSEVGSAQLVPGAKIKLYIQSVKDEPRGPKVIASRTDYSLIKKLFQDYISEIQDGTVDIKGIAREIGDRTKVCVVSHDPNVDPLGACLGQKGARIQEIIKRLDGEKIDLYEWSDDPKVLIANALKPAQVIAVIIDEKENKATAIVPKTQYSLAIGKSGQNVTLAVKSCGWNINIESIESAEEKGISLEGLIDFATDEEISSVKDRFEKL